MGWDMFKRIRSAMGQRGEKHQLSSIIEFDNSYFGGPTVGRKRGRGTEKAKVFVVLSLSELGNPLYHKMMVTPNIKRASIKNLPNPHLPRVAQSAVRATTVTARRWRATPTSTSLTIPTPVCCTGYTS